MGLMAVAKAVLFTAKDKI